MDALIDTFHIDWHLIIAQMVNFGIVVFVLYRFAIKPLGKLMEERSAKIAGGLTDAKKHKDLLSQTEEEYKKIVADARKESQEIVLSAKKDAEVVRAELVEKAKEEAGRIVADGKSQLDAERIKMLSDAKKELAGLVVSSTEKVLGSVLDSHVKAKIADAAAKEI